MAKAQEDYAHYLNIKRSDAHVYKLSDKWLGLFAVSRTYKQACALKLDGQFNGIFTVFYHSLLRPVEKPKTLGQVEIHKDSRDDQKGLIIVPDDRGRLQRKWVFNKVTDSFLDEKEGLQYLIEWQDGTTLWQPARNL
ncbi:Uu.00g096640.m01.CDS01 [Anthostomella pinea]|uniref:Uu.00g096640.m01.CDS01 n=1 Tax=Anthostomella pinea TaxID=933095 RepID=A0AAI8VD90_9PEZI|nr:Uu.00g096640.m01.CDS01 [Anthostomella pinea]